MKHMSLEIVAILIKGKAVLKNIKRLSLNLLSFLQFCFLLCSPVFNDHSYSNLNCGFYRHQAITLRLEWAAEAKLRFQTSSYLR